MHSSYSSTNRPAILTFLLFLLIRTIICDKINDDLNNLSNFSEITLNGNNKFCNGKKCPEFWMSRMGEIDPDLINVQALVIKEEVLPSPCQTGDPKSTKRHLMCAGSILNRNYILTSATCVHAATHIRHNVRGVLAVLVAPLKSNPQVIRVEDYKVNLHHNPNPFTKDFLKHNIAILRLACRIHLAHLVKIELPHAPFTQSCEEDNCIVPVYRKLTRTAWVMYQVLASVPLPKRKRRATTDDASGEIPDVKIRSKRKLAEAPNFSRRSEAREKNASRQEFPKESTTTTTTILSIEEAGIPDFTTETSPVATFDYVWPKTKIDNGTVRSFVVRSSDGHRGCPQLGTPVTLGRKQLAIVSVPCDDRQSTTKWGYTDLYENTGWVQRTLDNWSTSNLSPLDIEQVGQGSMPPGFGNRSSCSTCIFNFFIEIGCKNKARCSNGTVVKTLQDSKSHQGSGCPNSIGIEVDFGQKCIGDNEIARGDSPVKVPKLTPVIPSKSLQKVTKQKNKPKKYTVKASDSTRNSAEPSKSLETYKASTNEIKKQKKHNDEIELQNIDADSNNWFTEIDKTIDDGAENERNFEETKVK